jgi:hypothetical protein
LVDLLHFGSFKTIFFHEWLFAETDARKNAFDAYFMNEKNLAGLR